MVGLVFGEIQKVISVAGYQYELVFNGVAEYFRIARSRVQHIGHPVDFVTSLGKYPSHVLRYIVIEKELQSSAPAICLAINKSISSLWSS